MEFEDQPYKVRRAILPYFKELVLHDVHKKQLLTYLKLSGKKVGILVNFNVASLEDKISLIRFVK